MVEFQRSQRWMLHGSWPIWQTAHILLVPPQAKRRAHSLQVFDELTNRCIARVACIIRAELGHQVLRLCCPVQVERARFTQKEAPDNVARVRQAWLAKLE